MKAKLIALNIPAGNTQAGASFYATLFGLKMARALSDQVESYHLPTQEGQFIWLTPPQHEADTAPVAYFAVENLESSAKTLRDNGGSDIGGVMEMPMSPATRKDYADRLKELMVDEALTDNWGRVQLMRDPNGMLVGLVEIEPHSHVFYGLGKYGSMRMSVAALNEHNRSLELGRKIG